MVEQRTALANPLRSLLAESGIIIPVGIPRLLQQLPDLTEDASHSITFTLRRLLSPLREDMLALNEKITSLADEITALSAQQTSYCHLLTIPVVGPLIAAAFISEVTVTEFSSGRDLSARCGWFHDSTVPGETKVVFPDKEWQSKSRRLAIYFTGLTITANEIYLPADFSPPL